MAQKLPLNSREGRARGRSNRTGINRSGAAYLTPAILDGRWMVRVSIGALLTERVHVEELWGTMRAEAEAGHCT